MSAAPRRDREFAPGQWVYVWRKPPRSMREPYTLQRDRWVRPGLVILQRGGSVWVAMRSRLWKCSSEQLRSANREESMGAEL
eukprot:14051060-Alexandrium_andersonii.AAC.1